MKILIVEDDPVVALSCRRVLEAEGLDVQFADSVEMGEALLAAESFDLMLTDNKMPGRDGFDMINQAQKIRPEMPILMMTGYLTPDTIEQARCSGAAACIAKPFTPDELREAIYRLRDSVTAREKPADKGDS